MSLKFQGTVSWAGGTVHKKLKSLFLAVFLLSTATLCAQSTSVTNGNWNTGSVWGGSVPSTGWTTINVGHTITKSANHTVSGTLNVNAAGNLTINGDVTISGGSTLNVYGNMTITGSLTLNSYVYIHPGGTLTVNGSTYVVNANYLQIGTAAGGPPYANMIIKQNLVSQSSGDITVARNGRLAVFGNITSSGGGTFIAVNDGGQVYVNGTMNFNGGNDHITNNNDGVPYYGFYSPNTPTYTGGGSGTNGAAGANGVQDVSNMPTNFYNWVSTIPGSPLAVMPVTLLDFKAGVEGETVVLQWSTTTESDFSHFEVEQAGDDLQFAAIGQVQGAGYATNDVQAYSFTHNNPVQGTNYYRLKAVDTDGSYNYFYVVRVVVTSPKSVYVYANPSNGQFINVAANFSPGENTWVLVYRADGTLISRNSISDRDARIDFASQLATGVYLAKYITNGYSQTMRFVVQ
jgi:hypothetical protein